jgi:K(+)-stimulated pyrophosphate-energized sodium pump
VGDTVGDPFKDTSSVAMNPVIKFTTLFGLLAVQLAERMEHQYGGELRHGISAALFVVMLFFVYRSFYNMRIESGSSPTPTSDDNKTESKKEDESAPEPAE